LTDLKHWIYTSIFRIFAQLKHFSFREEGPYKLS
jgi:hypothetical protein